MGKSWCGSSQKEIEERKRSEQFVCVTCGSKTICKSCLRIPKELLKQ